MKAIVNIARVTVGVLFIFSGLVKANDPLGLSYKMQEFFEIWGIHRFNSWSLLMSVLMNAFEIIAGFALLLGWRIKLFSWLLLLLIIFFTFLTGYTYITGMPKNCGCFGDCLPITSKTSFLKDVVLTVLIGFLFWKKKLIQPLFNVKAVTGLMLLITVLSFGFQWYTLTYLPVVDCLPFKKGNNITEKMKMPANAIPDSTVITYMYVKGGVVIEFEKDKKPADFNKKSFHFVKEYDKEVSAGSMVKTSVYVKGDSVIEFTADKFPADFSAGRYAFVKRFDKIIRAGKNNEPPIKGFVLTGETNVDSTAFVLSQPYTVLLFIEKFTTAGNSWKKNFEEVYVSAKQKNIPCYIITGEPDEAAKAISGTSFAAIPVFKCDYKIIETAARSNPCIYLLKNGIVFSKYAGPRISKMKGDIGNTPMQLILAPVPVITDSLIQPLPK
jgi:uncharacterized membrane protein YphA (DoxX/SURF4 family)